MMMLFFGKEHKKENTCAHRTNKTGTKTAPLQVRLSCPRCLYIKMTFRKRALSWAPRTFRGSLTLEAAMCLSLFLFLSVCLIMPLRIMDRQRQIQAVMESVGEELSLFAYVDACFRNSGEDVVDTERAVNGTEDLQKADKKAAAAALGTAYAASRILAQIDKSWIQHVSFQGTDIGTDDMVHIEMSYKMRLPFTVLGLGSISVTQVCSRRMWTGAEGGSHKGEHRGTGEQEEMVYIGKNSTRYHRQRTCHYLYNNLKAVSAGSAEEMQNQSGARYVPCRRCGAGLGIGMVYVMPYGKSYHAYRNCSSIIAYVQKAPLSQVAHMGACSYCGGK